MLAERSRNREKVLQVLDKLAYYYTGQGQAGWNSAIEFTNQRLGIEPWHEETHRELMRLYAVSGQRSNALKQYGKCQDILMDELGVEPGAETIQLYETIQNTSSRALLADLVENMELFTSHGMPRSITETVSRGELPSNNIPHLPTDFLGREEELELLDEFVIQKKSQLVTITGPGGIGKTRLAIEFAEQYPKAVADRYSKDDNSQYQFPDGIFFVSLEEINSGKSIMPAIAASVGFRLDHDEGQLFQYSKSKHLLLILDNFEHMLESAATLTDIINSAPNVQILVTSRENLKLYGEQAIPLQGLAFPAQSITNISEFSAGQLFLRSALRQNPKFTLEESDQEHLVKICQLVEGMPLALELAATWTNSIPLSSIAEQIQNNLEFLSADMSNLPPRHRSLRAVIEGSLEKLLPNEKKLFSQLVVFEGGFTLPAASGVTSAEFQHLAALIDKSLLRYNKRQDRYFIHALLRQYGMEKLPHDEQNINDRHSQYYCEWFADQTNPKTLKTKGQIFILDAMTAEIENTRKAWLWALHNGKFERLNGKTDSFGLYYMWRGGYLEGERTFRSLIDTIDSEISTEDEYHSLVSASMYNWHAFFLDILGNSSKSLSLLQESRNLLNSHVLSNSDVRGEKAHNLMIYARVDQSQTEKSRTNHISQARELYREVNHPSGLPFALTSSARFALLDGKHKEAEKYLQESLEIYRKIGNDIGLTISLVGMGNHSFVQNEYRLARDYFQESIEIAKEFNSPERVIVATLFLGTAHLFSGQSNRAIRDLENCVRDSEERGLQTFQATAQYYLGYAWLLHGNYDQSVICADLALPMAERTGDMEVISQSRMLPAAVELARGKYQKALKIFQEIENIRVPRRTGKLVFGEDCSNFGLACSLIYLGETTSARQILLDYLQDAVASQRLDKLLYTFSGLALLNMNLGNEQLAHYLFRITSSYPFVRNSQWFNDVMREPIRKNLNHYPDGDEKMIDHKGIWEYASDMISKI